MNTETEVADLVAEIMERVRSLPDLIEEVRDRAAAMEAEGAAAGARARLTLDQAHEHAVSMVSWVGSGASALALSPK